MSQDQFFTKSLLFHFSLKNINRKLGQTCSQWSDRSPRMYSEGTRLPQLHPQPPSLSRGPLPEKPRRAPTCQSSHRQAAGSRARHRPSCTGTGSRAVAHSLSCLLLPQIHIHLPSLIPRRPAGTEPHSSPGGPTRLERHFPSLRTLIWGSCCSLSELCTMQCLVCTFPETGIQGEVRTRVPNHPLYPFSSGKAFRGVPVMHSGSFHCGYSKSVFCARQTEFQKALACM